MREQYPQGSRIRLREMKDPYNPVEPGTMGTLNFIDDLGTFHCNWDNGRTLGLVMGEDSFSVLPPEATLLKLYMPMTVTYYERNDYGDMENDELTMDDRPATRTELPCAPPPAGHDATASSRSFPAKATWSPHSGGSAAIHPHRFSIGNNLPSPQRTTRMTTRPP